MHWVLPGRLRHRLMDTGERVSDPPPGAIFLGKR